MHMIHIIGPKDGGMLYASKKRVVETISLITGFEYKVKLQSHHLHGHEDIIPDNVYTNLCMQVPVLLYLCCVRAYFSW